MEHRESQTIPSEQAIPEPAGDADGSNATFQQRFGAFLFDWLIFSFFWRLLAYVISRFGIERADDWAIILGLLLYWIGFVAVGVTPASWFFNIRIVDHRNRAPGLRRAFRRSLIPGTVWVLLADGAVLFDPRIDSFFESNPVVENLLFWGGGLVLMLYSWVYFCKSDPESLPTIWHDRIAGTRVIEYREPHKAALDCGIRDLRKAPGRSRAVSRQGYRSNLDDRQVRQVGEEV
jgi:hypothetical protein